MPFQSTVTALNIPREVFSTALNSTCWPIEGLHAPMPATAAPRWSSRLQPSLATRIADTQKRIINRIPNTQSARARLAPLVCEDLVPRRFCLLLLIMVRRDAAVIACYLRLIVVGNLTGTVCSAPKSGACEKWALACHSQDNTRIRWPNHLPWCYVSCALCLHLG